MDDAPTDATPPGRFAGWWRPQPAELVGLAVLLLGAAVLTVLVALGASSRTEPSFASSSHDAPASGHLDAPGEVGARIDAAGRASGPAPGVEADQAAGHGSDDGHGQHDGYGSDDASGDGHGQHDGYGAATDAASASSPPETTLVVHVSGAVRAPGVVTVPAGARVGDAVTVAGGAADGALLERLNLARPLLDGEHVRVPHAEDDPDDLPPIGGGTAPPAGAPGVSSAGGPGGVEAGGAPSGGPPGSGVDAAGLVRINHADAAVLESLPGIGPARAETIVAHRTEHGAFGAPGDLRAVSGIGEATFQRLAPLITVD
ncbi:MAG: helix-hairpin-helix domain-containing protein [Nitriliruptoraceae bacterium]|nr:helix-hairpin-helix domain-containing protein [Nitriliruptoraceae bacterium]